MKLLVVCVLVCAWGCRQAGAADHRLGLKQAHRAVVKWERAHPDGRPFRVHECRRVKRRVADCRVTFPLTPFVGSPATFSCTVWNRATLSHGRVRVRGLAGADCV